MCKCEHVRIIQNHNNTKYIEEDRKSVSVFEINEKTMHTKNIESMNIAMLHNNLSSDNLFGKQRGSSYKKSVQF